MKQTGGPAKESASVEPIRRTLIVRGDAGRAFRLFTEQMGTWWPVESYSRAVSEFEGLGITVERLEFQARMGGSLLEHMSDGRTLPWAEVIVWEPPHRVVMAWRPHSQPEPPTEIEVTFTERDASTLVEVDHRGWERLSDGFRETLYDIYVRGWTTTLAAYAGLTDRDET